MTRATGSGSLPGASCFGGNPASKPNPVEVTASAGYQPGDLQTVERKHLMEVERKLPCGCRGSLRGEYVVIESEAFLCAQRHKQGALLMLADVASLAVAAALDDAELERYEVTRQEDAARIETLLGERKLFAFGRETSRPEFDPAGLYLVCDGCGWFSGDAALREGVRAVCEDCGAERLSAFAWIVPALGYQEQVRRDV